LKPTLLILAAGIGSRYGGLKQADGVGPSAEAILDYSIYDALKTGFGKVVFVIRRDIEEDMKKIFFDKWKEKVEIDYVFQEADDLPSDYHPPYGRTKPWGTGHAIWSARDKIREPFAVINADDFYGRDSYILASAFLSDIINLINGRYCLIGFILKNTLSEFGYVSRAECRTDRQKNLTGIIERLKVKKVGNEVLYEKSEGQHVRISEDTIVSMNMWGFMPSFFSYLEKHMEKFLEQYAQDLGAEFLLPTVIDSLIRANEVMVSVLPTSARWFGMTYREDREIVKAKLAELIRQGIYPTPIWS
jgi:UTP-glucose-1-phosphate uridylyltransferase